MKNLGGRWQPAQIQARPPGQPALRSTARGQMRVAVRAYPEPSAPDEEVAPDARAHATARDAMEMAQAAQSAPDAEEAPDARAHATARELRAADAVRAAAGPAGRRHRPAARLALPASPVLCHPKRPAAEQPPSTAAQPQTEFQPTASFESPFPRAPGAPCRDA